LIQLIPAKEPQNVAVVVAAGWTRRKPGSRRCKHNSRLPPPSRRRSPTDSPMVRASFSSSRPMARSYGVSAIGWAASKRRSTSIPGQPLRFRRLAKSVAWRERR
jgi:hypothetical protein